MPNKLTRIAVLASMTLAAPATAAANTCEVPASAPVFSAFGDKNHYFLAQGGSFETGLTWAASGRASIVPAAVPFKLGTALNTRSLRLQKDAKVTTARFCVTKELPHLRFVARSVGSGQLDVEVRVYAPNGKVTDSSSGSVSPSDHARWTPSRFVDLKTDAIKGTVGYIDVVFKSQGDWYLDDVFVDPRARV